MQIDKLLRIQRLRSTEDLLATVDEAEQLLNDYEEMVAHQVENAHLLGVHICLFICRLEQSQR